jgi:uncharacterized Zn finger protein
MKCLKCSSDLPPIIKETPPHKTAYCANCGQYIKHVRQQPEDDFTLFFGKYKDRNVKSMLEVKEEREYLVWLFDKATTLKDNQRHIIKKLIHV